MQTDDNRLVYLRKGREDPDSLKLLEVENVTDVTTAGTISIPDGAYISNCRLYRFNNPSIIKYDPGVSPVRNASGEHLSGKAVDNVSDYLLYIGLNDSVYMVKDGSNPREVGLIATQISMGGDMFLTGKYTYTAIDITGKLWTWGYNKYGQLGLGSRAPGYVSEPTRVLGHTVKSVAMSEYNLFFIDENNLLWSAGVLTESSKPIRYLDIHISKVIEWRL